MQRLKRNLEAKSPKTVNNVLAVLSVLLQKAVEWEVIERMPCSVKLLPVPKGSTAFHDFDEYERLVEAARALDPRTHLIVLLGGEAELRCGEMIALEWGDVDLVNWQFAFAGPIGPTRDDAQGWEGSSSDDLSASHRPLRSAAAIRLLLTLEMLGSRMEE